MNYRFLLTLTLTFLISYTYAQVCLQNGIELTTQSDIDSFPQKFVGCDSIYGDLTISGADITNVDSLQQLSYIGGNLFITGNLNLISLKGLSNITVVDGSLSIASNDSLTTISGLHNVEEVLGDFALKGNPLLDSLSNETFAIDTIWGNLQITNNDHLKSINSLIGIGYINSIEITNNRLLSSLIGLEGITSLKGHLDIGNNTSLTHLEGLESLSNIGEYLTVYGNKTLVDLNALNSLKNIGTNFNLFFNDSLKNIEGLKSLNTINGLISISGNNYLTSLSGLDSIDVDGISYLEIFFNRSLELCNTPVICEYLGNCGVANIYKNNTTCEYLSDVQNACGLENTSYIYEESNCDSIVYQGVLYDQSGIFVQTIPSTTGGCDTTVTLFLNIPQSNFDEISISACDSFIFGIDTLYESGQYTYFGTNIFGCDSTVVLNLQINGPTADTIDITTCVSAEVNGAIYTESGSYTQSLINQNGCDSTLLVNVVITGGVPSHDTIYFISCDIYILDGDTITQDTQWTHNFVNAQLCDSSITTIIQLKYSTFGTTEAVDCGSATVNGVEYFESGVFQQVLTNVAGCDSLLEVNVTLLNGNHSFVSITLSECNSYLFNGDTLIETGVYVDTLTNRFGCDSIITLNLTILEDKVETFVLTTCESYTANGETFTTSGTYTQHLLTDEGCDSVLIISLEILPGNHSEETIVETACDSIIINNIFYDESGSYIQNLTNASGCDSTLTINLSIFNSFDTIINAKACEEYYLNGQRYVESGIFRQFFTTTNGCDSNYVLNLIIGNQSDTTFSATACDAYVINSQNYTESGTYTQLLFNEAGCDSLITLHLTILDSSNMLTIFDIESCDPYTFNGVTYDSTGRYVQKFTNSVGCDSSVQINLTILLPSSDTIVSSSCGSFSINDSTYTVSGTYVQQLTAANGCDSLLYLFLIIHQSGSFTLNEVTCDSFEYNGFVYYQSGTYTQFIEDENGCDSIITLNLSVVTLNTTITQEGNIIYVQSDPINEYHWINCVTGDLIEDETLFSFTPEENGEYACIISNGQCKDTTECVSFISGVNNANDVLRWSISPNPTTGQFIVSYGDNANNVDVQLFDQMGRKISLETEIDQNKVIVQSALQPGIYTVQLQANGTSQVKKVIVVK